MKILIVEDTLRHMEEAVRVANSMGLEVCVAGTFSEALKFIYPKGRSLPPVVSGIVTDIYLPSPDGSIGDLDPDGIFVALVARKNRIPVVLCSDVYHHAKSFRWLGSLINFLEMDLVDLGEDMTEGNFRSKNWKRAFEEVLERIDRA